RLMERQCEFDCSTTVSVPPTNCTEALVMVFRRTSEGLDWLQRLQAAWDAIPESLRTWIKGIVVSALVGVGAAIVAIVRRLEPEQWYWLVIGSSALAAATYALVHSVQTERSLMSTRQTRQSGSAMS